MSVTALVLVAVVRADDPFGFALAAGDFNGDGADDLARSILADKGLADASTRDRGSVVVRYGVSGVGLASDLVSTVLRQVSFMNPPEVGEVFGASLESCDFNGDGFDDLAVGVRLGGHLGREDAGAVQVHFGGSSGLHFTPKGFFAQSRPGVAGDAEDNDGFGSVLACGDFNKDGFADLAIGHAGETLAGPDSGEVTILVGSASGLSDARTREIAAGLEGVPGAPGPSNAPLARALAAGDFDGDGHADLAIGMTEDAANGLVDGGSPTVLRGALFADGLDAGDTSRWSETVSPPTGNRVEAAKAARLNGSGLFGLAVVMPGGRSLGMPAFVRVGPDRGFANERVLKGSFFIDPQSLTITPTTDQNFFRFMDFQDGIGPSAKTRLSFEFLGMSTAYAIVATSFNEATNTLQVVAPAILTAKDDSDERVIKIDFEWRAGSAGAAGQLTMWHTFFSTGAPAASGQVQLFSVPLPNTAHAVVNAVAVGMVSGQDPGTFGQLFLDELSFRR